MAKYTTRLQTVIESYAQPGDTMREAIERGRKKLFDFDYPFFDPEYKNVFETNFIRNFYMREIGFETYGLFKFQLETWLMINMPYFNKMFESELIEYDPLSNTHLDTKHTKTVENEQDTSADSNTVKTTNIESEKKAKTDGTIITGTEENSTSTTSNETTTNTETNEDTTTTQDNFNRDLESQTPDGRLNLTANDGEGVIEYASNIKERTENNETTANVSGDSSETSTNEGTATTESTSDELQTTNVQTNETDNTDATDNTQKTDTVNTTANTTEEFVYERLGKIGVQSYAKMVKEYRDTLLRIERDIFNEMNELFMLVY